MPGSCSGLPSVPPQHAVLSILLANAMSPSIIFSILGSRGIPQFVTRRGTAVLLKQTLHVPAPRGIVDPPRPSLHAPPQQAVLDPFRLADHYILQQRILVISTPRRPCVYGSSKDRTSLPPSPSRLGNSRANLPLSHISGLTGSVGATEKVFSTAVIQWT